MRKDSTFNATEAIDRNHFQAIALDRIGDLLGSVIDSASGSCVPMKHDEAAQKLAEVFEYFNNSQNYVDGVLLAEAVQENLFRETSEYSKASFEWFGKLAPVTFDTPTIEAPLMRKSSNALKIGKITVDSIKSAVADKADENRNAEQGLTAECRAQIGLNFDAMTAKQKGAVLVEINGLCLPLSGDEEISLRSFYNDLHDRAKRLHPNFDVSMCDNYFAGFHPSEAVEGFFWNREGYTLRLIVDANDIVVESRYIPRADNFYSLEVLPENHSKNDDFRKQLQLAANLSALLELLEREDKDDAATSIWNAVSDHNTVDVNGIGNILNMLFGESAFEALQSQPRHVPSVADDVAPLVMEILSSEVLDGKLKESLAREFAEHLTGEQLILCADDRLFPQVVTDKINADFPDDNGSLETVNGEILAVALSEILNNPNLPPKIYNYIADGIAEAFNDLKNKETVNDSPEYIKLVLDACATETE